jgi:membrane protease YdiL (CAAX protease family)
MPTVDLDEMKPFGFLATALAFGGAAVFLWAATWPFHALFVSITGVEPIIGWFALGGLIFATLILAVGGIAAVGVSTGVVMVFIVGIAESAQPAFLSLTPLGADRLWILLVWVPFWLLNILGEEFLWRGVILPRQELAFGQHAWLANAAGWLVFHLACGWAVILLVTPIVFILPWTGERVEWKRATPERRKILGPLLWIAPFGLVNVMRRAVPLTLGQHQELHRNHGSPKWDYMPGGPSSPLEHKASDWGNLDGRLVALDYPAIQLTDS